MMTHTFRAPLLVALAFGLGACATSKEQCDPRNADASFSAKFGCSTQGVYAERVQEKEAILLDEQKANRLFRDVYAAIELERAAIGKERGEQEQAYAALNRSLAALLGEIRQKAQGNAGIEAEIAAIETELANINQQENPAVLQRRVELQKLRDKVVALEGDLGLR